MAKQKKGIDREEPNLRRLRSEIKSFTNLDHKYSPEKQKHKRTRKEKRKQARVQKKSRRNAYSRRQSIPMLEETVQSSVLVEEQREKIKLQKLEEINKKKKERKAKKKMKDQEMKFLQMKAETLYDDKEIKMLEKKLGLNKRKKKNTLPQSFRNDGLDYILDVVDAGKLQAMSEMAEADSDDFGLMEADEDDSDVPASESDSESGDKGIKVKKVTEKYIKNSTADSKSILSKGSKDLEAVESIKKEKWEELTEKIIKITEKRTKKKVSFADNSSGVIGGENDNDLEVEESDDIKNEGTFIDDDSDMLEDNDNYEDMEMIDYSDNDEDTSLDVESLKSDTKNVDESDMTVDQKEYSKFKQNKFADELKEDIYGRLRDKAGNIVVDNKSSGVSKSYVPPAKRLFLAETNDEKRKLQIERLKKQLKGLVNRASENNMQQVISQIEDLYLSNSRADVNGSLVELICDACIGPAVTPERLSMELMMLVAILHGNVGSEVGAVLLQNFAKRFDELMKQQNYGDGKYIDNVVILLGHLYNFKVIDNVLIFDILTKFTDSFTEKDIELILVILKNVGFSLRKDSPIGLRDFILKVQSRASGSTSTSLLDQSRVRFMLDVIMAIRNNNMRKIPNYDPEHLEHLQKLLCTYIRGGQIGDNQLHVTLEDLINADLHGKWWLVGSAWDGGSGNRQMRKDAAVSPEEGKLEVSSKLQQMAQKLRMNTDLRRNIFFIIMTSEDYLDAFEKLLKLGLKSGQQQEIVLIILKCCLQERNYNPFYAHLGQKLCEHHRSYQMAFQFCLWDKFKEIASLSETSRVNLGKLLTHLFINKALSLSVLKTIAFGTLEKDMIRLLKLVFSDLLLNHSQDLVEAAFSRIAMIDKFRALNDGLRLFLRHFLLGGKKNEVKNVRLAEMVEMVDTLLLKGRKTILL